MSGQKRIAVMLATAKTKDRRLVRGILKFSHHKDDWELHPFYRPLDGEFPLDMLKQFDGIIARIDHPEIERRVSSMDIPTIRVSAFNETGLLPTVMADYRAAGHHAAEHLIEIGLKQFAFYMKQPRYSGRLCREGFADALGRHALSCHFPPHNLLTDQNDPFEEVSDALVRWVDSLPKPVGIFCSCDNDGRTILQVCDRLGINGTDQVAVIAVNNDDMICELCQPKLSSVDLLHENVGYSAAELLDGVLDGQQPDEQTTWIEPGAVVSRSSTSMLAISDPIVRRSLLFIRNNIEKGISVEDVIQHVDVSRATLDRRFNAALGHTVAHAIRQSRIRRAKDLLAKTDMALPDIAVRTGFRYQPRLSTAFKEATGQTPREYRQCRRT